MAASKGRHQFSSDEEEDLHEEMPNYMAGDYGVGEEHLGVPGMNMVRNAMKHMVPAAARALHRTTFTPVVPAIKAAQARFQGPGEGKSAADRMRRAQAYIAKPDDIKLLTNQKKEKPTKQKQQDVTGAGNTVELVNALVKLLHAATGTTKQSKGGENKKMRRWKKVECDTWMPPKDGESQEDQKKRRKEATELIKAAEKEPAKAAKRYNEVLTQLTKARAAVQGKYEERIEFVKENWPVTSELWDLVDPTSEHEDVYHIGLQLDKIMAELKQGVEDGTIAGGPYTLTKKLLGKDPITSAKVYRSLARRWLVKNSRKYIKANGHETFEEYKTLSKAIRKISKENHAGDLKRSADHWYSVLHPREKKAE